MPRIYRSRKVQGWSAVLTLLITLAVFAAGQAGWLDSVQETAVRQQPGLYKVSRFVDGDTIQVDMNGKPEKIRMVGVDTPETHKPGAPVQCYGPAASAFTQNTIGNQPLRLVSDPLSTDRDRYDRLLRYVYLPDGRMMNQLLIQEGYGFYYPYFPFTKSTQFEADQQTAMVTRKGLWGNCSPSQTDRGGYISNDQG